VKRISVTMLAVCIYIGALLGGQSAFAVAANNINVRNYGAVGNGLTDDTAAINAAFATCASGDSVYFPPGTYLVKAPSAGTESIIHFNKTNITIFGDGAGVSTIKVANSCPTYKWVLGPTADSTNLSGLKIYGLTFDHNIANNAITNEAEIVAWPEYSCGCYVGSNLYFHDLQITNASSFINIIAADWSGTTDNVTVDNVRADHIGDDPNHIEHDASIININGNHLTVTNCNFSCNTAGLPGGSTAFEIHGSNILCQYNTITNAEDYEGVLVRVQNVKVVPFNTDPTVPVTGGSFRVVALPAMADTILVSSLGNTYPDYTPVIGTVLNVTGVLNIDTDVPRILPRSSADIVDGTAGVPSSNSTPSKITFSVGPSPARIATVRFALPRQADVDLSVFDLSGRKIVTLAKGSMPAKAYEYKWNGSGAGAGVYFVRLRVGSETYNLRTVSLK